MAEDKQIEYRNDPCLSCNFLVEINGVIGAGFTQCSGFQVETEYEDYHEGGVNDFIHKLPKFSKQQTITLKKGITDSNELWEWHLNIVHGIIIKKNITIILLESDGEEMCRFNVMKAYPVKWVGPEFNAAQAQVAIETLELVHHGITKG